MKTQYCFSTNQETFEGDCASRAEAIEEGFENTDNDSITTGIKKPFDFSIAGYVINRLQCLAFEEVGDVSDDWLCGVTPEASDDLDCVIKDWLKRHKLEPDFFCVDDIETHRREDELIANK